MNLPLAHTFHIPVMGIGFTIDTPAKVAHLGISSAISLVDDMLMEKMREFYCKKLDLPFQAISKKMDDFRAKRITTYLNLMEEIVQRNKEELHRNLLEKKEEANQYLEMFNGAEGLKHQLLDVLREYSPQKALDWLKAQLPTGSIDVNIMTKLDKDQYDGEEKLPTEYRDAHAALRGVAKSRLQSFLVLSAGINPSLHRYIEQFDDFFPDAAGELKKKIILKVSDYRSALVQGKFLAKRGIWVSEFRLESGLNCGGHAFATDGFLMGPILEEFKQKRACLISDIHQVYTATLAERNRTVPAAVLPVKFTAQGGVGTAEEHQMLLDYYQLDSVGWGSPFLLVPEAVNTDEKTRKLLEKAKEEDLYLSDVSPLGVPFNNLRGNTKDLQKYKNIDKGRPGSSCPKKYASLNTEFTERVICTASRQYQQLKLQELEEKQLAEKDYRKEYEKVTEKSCICVGLGTSALLTNRLDTKTEGEGVSVCPGPNIAYFSETVSIKSMLAHIYGKDNLIRRNDRPLVFLKELSLYVDYFQKKKGELPDGPSEKERKCLDTFRKNLQVGIDYYKSLFLKPDFKISLSREILFVELDKFRQSLDKEVVLS